MIGLIYRKTFWPFFGLMLLHCFFYVPTMSVTNAIAFANIKDAQKDFGFIRVWGTIGWIAASWPFIFIPIDWAKVPSMERPGASSPGWERRWGRSRPGTAMEAALTSTFTGRGDRLVRSRGVLPDLAAHAARRRSGIGVRPAGSVQALAVPSILVLFIVTFLDSLVHYLLFLLDRPLLSRDRPGGELDRAGDEHRPDRRDRDDGLARAFSSRGWAGGRR